MVLGTLVVVTILVALFFDFINGFHDSANAIATVVATRVLKPFQAVLMAGVFNFVGPFVFSLAVANTVGKGIIDTGRVDTIVIFGALVGAIVWDLATWWIGLPTSSSHALVGGLIGAAIAAAGLHSVFWPTPAEGTIILLSLAKGAVGGLVVGLAFVPLSRIRLPRFLLWALMFFGIAAMGYFSYSHTHYAPLSQLNLHTLRNYTKPILVNFVFCFIGAVAGSLIWVATQQPLRLRALPHFLLPGAAGFLGTQTLLGTIKLGGLTKTLLFMFVSPVLGFYMGFLMTAVINWIGRDMHAATVTTASRRMQLGSSAFYALTHGTNDAQKTMGVIGVLLLSAGAIGTLPGGSLDLPVWVIVSSAVAMGLGTAFGGWRIVKTMAARITHLTPIQGFAAEAGGGVVLVAMAEAGIPVSTTHAISGSIMGVGATRRLSAVRWGVGRQMFIAWILTIPASAFVAALCYYLLKAVLAVVT